MTTPKHEVAYSAEPVLEAAVTTPEIHVADAGHDIPVDADVVAVTGISTELSPEQRRLVRAAQRSSASQLGSMTAHWR